MSTELSQSGTSVLRSCWLLVMRGSEWSRLVRVRFPHPTREPESRREPTNDTCHGFTGVKQLLVLVDVDDDGVATITLNRPERNNAWTPELEHEYIQALRTVDVDRRVRAVVLTGAGRSFCPGVDVGRLASAVGADLDLEGRSSPTSPLGVRKPMIAAINGACAGIGLVHALMCDIRFVARGARLSTSFARRGLAAEYGAAYMLPRIIGPERALDLLLSGRTIEADEALEIGLVSRVVEREDILGAAQGYARELATKSSPVAMALAKHQVWTALDQSLAEAMDSTYRAMRAAISAPDFDEGVASFLEKRNPAFAGLSADLRPAEITGVEVATAFDRLSGYGVIDGS